MGKFSSSHTSSLTVETNKPPQWFFCVFVISFIFALVASLVWDTKLTWWGFILCVLIGVALTLPVGK